jgi:ABC-type dipeptide/oligopeptide/nickel transport system ATPase subunit
MLLTLKIANIQHVSTATLIINLEENKLIGIVGKNGVGKTTVIKSIKNLSSADTFTKTSAAGIFHEDSTIFYQADKEEYLFTYDVDLKSLNCKKIIPEHIKKMIEVELPMPYGQRFNFFQSISDSDQEIRKSIVLEKYSRPTELINFLSEIYGTQKFDDLIEIEIRGINYYCILQENSRYIREDYLSSGEYFLISLYRKIKSYCKLIVIDEIDISLDAAAQVHLINKLREFCTRYEVNILFTTHSLAMIRTLSDGELLYMQESNGAVEIFPASYSYIKSILFGFTGWDKYILTEDKLLKNLLELIIQRYCHNTYYKYKIIYVGGARNVVDLMDRNAKEHFLSSPENVISILDGDQRNFRYVKSSDSTFCIPFESVEKALHQDYQNPSFQPRLPDIYAAAILDDKALYSKMLNDKVMSEGQILDYLIDKHDDDMRSFSEVLSKFLCPPH